MSHGGAISPEAYLEFNIQAPPPPSSVEVQNGYFSLTLIPKISELTSVSTQFDFWTSGETKLSSTNTDVVERDATREGMGTVWQKNNLLNDHVYYWYVRTINAFGSSSFVEVEARVWAETGQIIEIMDKEFQETETFKNLMETVQKVDDGVTELSKVVEGQASKIDSVQTSVGDVVVTVQQQSQALADLNGKLSAQWGQKVQIDSNGNKYVAGMQLGIEGSGGQFQSYFMVSADNFAVYNPVAGAAQLAFAIKNGQAFLRDGFIENGSITNAKIGNVIQSNNWNGNDQGWAITKDGYCVFNNVTVRGTVVANAGQFGFNGNGGITIDSNGIRVPLSGGGVVIVGRW